MGDQESTTTNESGQESEGFEQRKDAEGQGSSNDEPKTFDAAAMKKVRDEAAANRIRAKKAEDELEALRKKDMDALELARTEAAEAKKAAEAARAEMLQARRNAAITAAAAKARFPAEAALKLADVEMDEDGQPVGVSEAIEALVNQYPGMVAGAGSNGSNMGGSRGKKGNLTLADIKNKSPEWINANWDAVQEVMKKQGS